MSNFFYQCFIFISFFCFLLGCSQEYKLDVSKPGKNPDQIEVGSGSKSAEGSGTDGGGTDGGGTDGGGTDGGGTDGGGTDGGGTGSLQLDNFLSSQSQKVDILFVVDNSLSMDEDQTNLKNNLDVFINQFINKNVSYRIGVISTDDADNGKLDPKNVLNNITPAKRYLDNQSPNLVQNFKKMVELGVNGSGGERGLATTTKAMGLFNNSSSSQFGFIRNDAFLQIIYLSDEDESCFENTPDYNNTNLCKKKLYGYGLPLISSAPYYYGYETGVKLSNTINNLKTAFLNFGKNAPSNLKVDSIVHTSTPQHSGFNGKLGVIGEAYIQVATLFSGNSFNIEGNFSNHLQNIGSVISGVNLFKLSKAPLDANTIQVKLNGVNIPKSTTNGFVYDSISRSISFKGSAYQNLISVNGQSIEVEYLAL